MITFLLKEGEPVKVFQTKKEADLAIKKMGSQYSARGAHAYFSHCHPIYSLNATRMYCDFLDQKERQNG